MSSLKLSDLFKDFNLNDEFTINSSHISKFGYQVYDISKEIDGYSSIDTVLGKPYKSVRYVSLIRESAFWLAPRTGGSHFAIDRLGVLAVFERKDGIHVGVLPSSGTSDLCTSVLKSTKNGSIVIHSENDSKKSKDDGQKVFVSYGLEFDFVVQSLFEISKKTVFSGNDGDKDGLENVVEKLKNVYVKLNPKLKGDLSSSRSTTPSWNTQWFDGLMYCTWNGLGSVLENDSIVNCLHELQSSGIKVSGIIIDDGWQHSNERRQLYDLRADSFRFPNGLKGLVKEINKKFPYIKEIGVWSTLVGYWEGIVPGSELDDDYHTVDVKMKSGKIFRLVNAKETHEFYDNYFKSLSEAGITCVKIDYQAVVDDISDHKNRGELFTAYQESLFESSLKYFDGKVIYCMAMVPNIMLYSLQRDSYEDEFGQILARPTPVFRNSNDFFPKILSSHFWHIYTNLYNTIYTANLYSIPDFDMFQSKLEAGGEEPLASRVTSLHAAARCISGGPIYFTDKPEKHNIELIKSFSCLSKNNRRVVVRPTGIAKPVFPYQSFDSKKLHWGYNYSEVVDLSSESKSKNVNIILGAFNICYDEVDDDTNWINLIGNVKLASNTVSDDLVLRSYKTGKVWLPKDKSTTISLLSGDWDIITATPLIEIPGNPVLGLDDPLDGPPFDGPPSIGIFGFIDNICGVSAIHSYKFDTKADEILRIKIWVKALGILALYTRFSYKTVVVNVDGKLLDKARVVKSGILQIDLRHEGEGDSDGDDKQEEIDDELVLVEVLIN